MQDVQCMNPSYEETNQGNVIRLGGRWMDTLMLHSPTTLPRG
jgi:hypothetical protein